MTIYKYLNVTYNTLAEAEAAVTAFKNQLDNQPSTYCEMKELTGSNEEGWTPVTGLLTDAEMLALDDTKYYYVYSQYAGEAHHGLTAAEATAKKNEAYLLTQLDSDNGARYLGEFAIGTNYGIKRFTKNILFDEKIGGTIHMAVGIGYPETGSKNKSAIHWDFICDMREDSEILVDGDLFYKNGEFQI